MKRFQITLAFTLLGLVFLSFNQSPEQQRAPVMTFESQVFDFGTIKQSQPRNSDGKCEFVFTNTGNEPLIITGVRADCGCTAPHYTKEPVMPGETGKISVQYDNSRVGSFSKGITVTSNANPPSIRLTIRGSVVKAVDNTPVNPATLSAPTAR